MKDTDIESFFPDKHSFDTKQQELIGQKRYLFIASNNKAFFQSLQDSQLIKGFMQIPQKNDVYLIYFDRDKQAELLQKISALEYMGTPVLGSLLSSEFIDDTFDFLLLFIPFLMVLIILLTSPSYLLNVVDEVLGFLFMILAVIVLLDIELNSAYLLALLFTFIYVFTIINQVYYNRIVTGKLKLSLAASLITTWLSAFLLSISEFGVISDFGYSLMIWISVLAVYLTIRVVFMRRYIFELHWFEFRLTNIKLKWIGFLVTLILIFMSSLILFPLGVNLNPLGLSSHHSQISRFETDHILSQPVLLSIHSKCSLRELNCNKKLSELLVRLNAEIPMHFDPVSDLNLLYHEFSGGNFSTASAESFAQFMLALDMSSSDRLIYSRDYKVSYYMASVSIMQPIGKLLHLTAVVENISTQSKEFNIQIKGHLAKAAQYQQTFLHEMLRSIVYIFILLSILFSVMYKNLRVLVSLLPALLSSAILLIIHSLLQINLSVMTLIALILFMGLITDNMIHVLITYKTLQEKCFKLVFKPIILSNIIMIASLLLMVLVNHGFLQNFGVELAFLLATHLLFMIYLLPNLFKYFMPLQQAEENLL